jgi:hypothetical protein
MKKELLIMVPSCTSSGPSLSRCNPDSVFFGKDGANCSKAVGSNQRLVKGICFSCSAMSGFRK